MACAHVSPCVRTETWYLTVPFAPANANSQSVAGGKAMDEMPLRLCICAYTHTHTYKLHTTHMHTTCMYTYMDIHRHICTHTCTPTYRETNTHGACTYTHVCNPNEPMTVSARDLSPLRWLDLLTHMFPKSCFKFMCWHVHDICCSRHLCST